MPSMRWRWGGLWQHPDFVRLWAGQTVSLFGSEITELALPLTAVLVLRATPFEMAALVAAQTAPELLVGLFAGAWVDRLRRRPLMVAADLGRALALVSVPVAALAGWLTMQQLYAVGFVVGTLSVLFSVSYEAALPSLVGKGQLLAANSRLEASRSLAQVAGPGLAGVLVQVVTAPVVLLIDAVSFVVSAASIRMIRTHEPVPPAREPGQRIWREIGEGLRALAGHRLLRPMAICSGLLNGFGGLHGAVVLLFLVDYLGLQPATIGGLRALGSVWWLPGALLAGYVVRQIGQGLTVVLGAALVVIAGLALVAAGAFPAYAVPILIAGGVATGFANPLYNITGGSLKQAVTPDRLLGRVSASMSAIGVGLSPLGALLGGYLGQTIGLWPTLIVASAGQSLAVLTLLLSPMSSVRSRPGAALRAATGPGQPDHAAQSRRAGSS